MRKRNFELEEIKESEFPTKGRSYADQILDEFLEQSSTAVRVKTKTNDGREIGVGRFLFGNLKDRINERDIMVDVAIKDGYVYLRKVE